MKRTAVQQNFSIQKWVAAVSVLLLAVKLIAYFTTGSVAILSDALESIVNVVAGFIGLYSLYLSTVPRDENHPYGHGKAEFISAGIEGTMISVAGIIVLFKAVKNLVVPADIFKIDFGIMLISATAVINFITGFICIRVGKKNHSPALIASGRHLQTDTWSTAGIIGGLLLLYFTGYRWIDSAVAIVFGLIIVFTGYKIIRKSVAGIMDEADVALLNRFVRLLNAHRRENWVDLHNLRVIKYGSVLHVDCHLTVPWYLNVHEAHAEIETLAVLIRHEFGESLELFVHTDACLYTQCAICTKTKCPERKYALVKQKTWTLENILRNKKHESE